MSQASFYAHDKTRIHKNLLPRAAVLFLCVRMQNKMTHEHLGSFSLKSTDNMRVWYMRVSS